MLCAFLTASAYDFEVDGIYYNILSLDELTCAVTYKNTLYSGDITIPSKVSYKDREITVTGIGFAAFRNCSKLKSLSLPATIVQIESNAFDRCNPETLNAGNAYILNSFDKKEINSEDNNLKNLVLAKDFSGTIDVDFSGYRKLVFIRSNSVDVPSFSDGTHFSNQQYINNEVLVPEKSFSNYQSAEVWKSFWELKPMKTVKSIILNESSLSLEPNQTIQLVTTILPDDVFDTTVLWNSSNPEVASVNSNGLVKAITKGDAVITVSSTDGSDVMAQCAIHVDLKVKEIMLSETEIGLEPGETKKLDVTIKPENAFVKEVIWTSDAEDIASVDENGNIVAKNIGIANISARTTDGSDLTATCKVTVAHQLVKSIVVTPKEATIKEGETRQLTCSVLPETATYKNVVWESENNDVACVDANGNVTAISFGSTIIKAIATDGSNVCGTCNINVTANPVVIDGICYRRISTSTLAIIANPEKTYRGDFVIPSKADFNGIEMSVTEIEGNAFAECKELTRIIIPNTINEIGENAFKGCTSLQYVKLCDGSNVSANFDNLFADSPISELYIGSKYITYNHESKILNNLKGMTLGNNVSTFPPKEAFKSLKYFIVEDGDINITEPEDYCTSSTSLIKQQTVNDSYTHIYYRFFYLITYTHLSPILNALQDSTLDYLHIGREVQQVYDDRSKTRETIPTTAGDRYQEYGYMDEINYQYNGIIVKNDYNRNPIESISIDKNILGLNIGESFKLTATCLPKNASLPVFTWSSSNENIASVDIFGNVTKIADGEAIITATTTDGTNLTATCKIVNLGAGDEDIIVPADNGEYTVYNFQGIMVMKTDEIHQINQLPAGIYIVNGKKVLIR